MFKGSNDMQIENSHNFQSCTNNMQFLVNSFTGCSFWAFTNGILYISACNNSSIYVVSKYFQKNRWAECFKTIIMFKFVLIKLLNSIFCSITACQQSNKSYHSNFVNIQYKIYSTTDSSQLIPYSASMILIF